MQQESSPAYIGYEFLSFDFIYFYFYIFFGFARSEL